MAKLSMECKKLMVEEMSARLKRADGLIVTNYKGLNSQDLNELRRELRDVSAEYIVVKDSMAKRVFAEGPNSALAEFIEGEVGIAIDKGQDSTHVSKVLVRFSKDHNVLKIRGGIMSGDVISKEEISVLASLPSKEVLIGNLANVLNAPIQGLASVLSGILAKLLYALNAVRDKRSESGEAAAKGKEDSGSTGKTEEKDQASATPGENKETAKPEEKEKTIAGDSTQEDEGGKSKEEARGAENEEKDKVEEIKTEEDPGDKKKETENNKGQKETES